MIYSRIQFWILLFVVSCSLTFAQEEKPKVALVLSGGGAKGIAHIPLLQKLDSLGIVPDLVVGTSMGSAVGGLYAIGYSGDSIASIATNANWENILRGELSLDAVRNEEKSEFGRYAVSFDLVDGKPKLKNALLKDQELREFLTSLVYPVYEYNHFDEFYIPFRAVATDLVEGKEVVLEDGSLSTAIRASISIPGVFEPVKYEGTLLVDGGVVNNFPTDVAKRLGADIIIGSDVGEGMLPIEKLDNLPAVLFQTSMLTSGLKVEDNRKLCRVLVNHSDSLTYSTQDFVKAQGIYDQGKIATNANLDALVELANYLKTFKASPLRKKVVLSDIVVDGVKFKGISKGNQRFIEALINIETQKPYSVEDLKRKIDRAMGTEIFDQITFRALKEGNKTYIEYTGF